MKKGRGAEIEFGQWEFYMVRNKRGLCELLPKPMSIDQLIGAAANSLKRDLLLRSSVSNSRLEQRRMTARRLFNLAASKSWMSMSAASISWNMDLALELIAHANAGDPDADRVLRDAAGAFITRGLLLPLELGDYVVTAVLPESGKRSAAIKGKFHLRDRCIAYSVQQVMRHSSDLEATRGKATMNKGGKESACSIVVTAFGLAGGGGLSESSVNEIWRRLQREYPVRPRPKI
jgi:hypothetical protein